MTLTTGEKLLPIMCELEMSELPWQTFKEGIKYTLEQINVIWSKDLPDDCVHWEIPEDSPFTETIHEWMSMTFACLEVLK